MAQETPQQAPPGEPGTGGAAGAQAGHRRALAPRHRLARLCRADVGRARCHAGPAQSRRSARPRGASRLAPADAFRDSRPGARTRRLGPAVRPLLTQQEDTPSRMETALTLTTDMELVIGLVVFMMVMFLFERVRADVVALVVLMLLGLTRLVAPDRLFAGFSSNAV